MLLENNSPVTAPLDSPVTFPLTSFAVQLYFTPNVPLYKVFTSIAVEAPLHIVAPLAVTSTFGSTVTVLDIEVPRQFVVAGPFGVKV